MVYFSAHWSQTCREFTPKLAKAYKESTKAGTEVVVIFVSSDRDQAGFDESYGEMPWHALPFGVGDIESKLLEKWGVLGIPKLIVLDAQGNLVTAKGRDEFATYF